MRRSGWFLGWMGISIVTGALLATGCSQAGRSGDQANADGGRSGGVAVVDLDVVAQRVGQDVEMKQSIEQATASVNEQLKSIRDRLRREYQEEMAKANPAPVEGAETPAAPAATPAELAAIKQKYDRQFAQLDAQAREKLAQHRVGVLERFRGEVRPICEKIAAARGQSIVVTKNDAVVFAFLPQADITDDVVEQLSARVRPAAHVDPESKP